MNKVRLKQMRLLRIMKTMVILGALFIFIYIGIEPYVAQLSRSIADYLNIFCDALVVVVLIILFLYYSKYGKCASYLNNVENEINDYGYYITSRPEKSENEYIKAICDDLMSCGYSVNTGIEIYDFDFSLKAAKRKEYFYVANINDIDRNDVLAYLDAVIQDITVKSMKKSGDAVLCFITNNAADDAIALSKMITPIGKKERLKIAMAICEVTTGNVYFLGNSDDKCMRLIVNFVMNCDVPVKDQYIHKDKLQFQYDIEKKMESFSIKDFENGNFTVH